jgi:DUF4097 and DUF4098 domain-containing protein YvlB
MHTRLWLLLSLAAVAFNASAAEKRLDKSFQVSAGGTVRVEADGATINVKGSGSDQVRVLIEFEGSSSALENLELSAEATSEGVEVKAKRDAGNWRSWFSWGNTSKAQITISVPARYNTDLKTSGGDVLVEGLDGRAAGSTSGGDIRVREVSGPVKMHTSGGNISVSDIKADTKVGTSGGGIRAEHITGALTAQTSGGSIHVSDVRGKVLAETSSGDVVADKIVGDAQLNSSGGSIRAEADGSVTADTSGGGIDVVLIGSNRGINASTSGGSITLKIPSNSAATIDASTSGGSVGSDLPLVRTDGGERTIKGTLNGGGPLIRARTSGGSVRINAST